VSQHKANSSWNITLPFLTSFFLCLLCLFQADFLKGLPVYNKSNFSRFHADSVCKASVSIAYQPSNPAAWGGFLALLKGNYGQIN